MPWSTAFFDPILLPDGRELVTLEDAGHYVAAMPAAQQRHAHWQTAAEFLLLVAERGGDLLMARTDMMRALNHGILVSIVEPRRKRSRNYTLIR